MIQYASYLLWATGFAQVLNPHSGIALNLESAPSTGYRCKRTDRKLRYQRKVKTEISDHFGGGILSKRKTFYYISIADAENCWRLLRKLAKAP